MLSMNTSEVVEGHSRVDSKSWIEPFCGDMQKPPLDGPDLVHNLAMVYAWTNEPDLAFQTLNVSIKAPVGVSYGELKLDPDWDPLRSAPRFAKLLAQLAPHE